MAATYSSMCKKIQLSSSSSSSSCEEEQKQGIVSVLGSDFNRNRAASLRRTLSADMSSKKCLSHDSFSSSSSEGEEEQEEDEERFQIWRTIQRDKKDQKHDDGDGDGDENIPVPPPPAKLNTWSSILLDKAKEENSNNSVTPYIHPLVKRSKSCLSEKSLEICTESLGSETGSDHVFSNSSTQSETEDSGEEDFQVPKQNLPHQIAVISMRKSMARSFPPPLPSHHMRSHRDGNGRLFLEAVTVASHNNNFSAQRQDGRLVLSFASDEEEEEEKGEEFVGFEEDDDDDDVEEDENYDEEDEVVEVEAVMEEEEEEEEEPLLCNGVITRNVHRLELMMDKTKKWSEKLNEVVNFEGRVVAKSLPPRPRPRPRVMARLIPSASPVASAAAGASLNAYDCYWGTNHTSKVDQHNNYSSSSLVMKNNDRGSKVIFYGDVNYWNYSTSDGDQQNLVVMRAKNGDYLVHKSKTCKDSRRSFIFWEPPCIATS